MTEETGEWISCVVDDDYEIWSEYPYSIKRKNSNKLIKEKVDKKDGYTYCYLNRKRCLKHRIIAKQFITNPNALPEVDHINQIRTDNRVKNLRWVSHSENQKNKTGCRRQYVFLDELPDTAEPLETYGTHEFDDLWIDYENQKLYVFQGIKYRELLEHKTRYSMYYNTYDSDGKHLKLYHNVLFD